MDLGVSDSDSICEGVKGLGCKISGKLRRERGQKDSFDEDAGSRAERIKMI